MATPLLLYVVGLGPHTAIGTGALAVSVNAFVNCGAHARAGHVRWRSATLFAAAGAIGAAIGSSLGKTFDGERLLFLFALLMLAVGIVTLRRRPPPLCDYTEPPFTLRALAKIIAAALGVGLLAGFFGIGGGFLIVPGLMLSADMPMLAAIGSSLLAVGSFGLTTAVNYAASGLIDWPVAGEYIAGGVAGGLLGLRLCRTLAPRTAALNKVFAGIVFAAAAYMLYRTAGVLWSVP